MQKEIVIRLKGEDKKVYKRSFNCYEEGVVLSDNDPVLSKHVEDSKKEAHFPIEECEIIVKMVWS